jgi:hypothetical protein
MQSWCWLSRSSVLVLPGGWPVGSVFFFFLSSVFQQLLLGQLLLQWGVAALQSTRFPALVWLISVLVYKGLCLALSLRQGQGQWSISWLPLSAYCDGSLFVPQCCRAVWQWVPRVWALQSATFASSLLQAVACHLPAGSPPDICLLMVHVSLAPCLPPFSSVLSATPAPSTVC